jgi:thiol-disulfide isomerase/thioredoxin
MKKTGFVLLSVLSLLLVLGQGCKEKPAEEPAAVSQSQPAQQETQAVSQDNQQPKNSPAVQVGPQTQVQEAPVVRQEPAYPVWMTDFEAAQKRAAAESKDLLFNFTGSDWCPGCIQLEREVLGQKLFIYEARKRFVFVMVDFPRKKKLSPSLEQQNERLAQRYGIGSFPTILLADATGKPYAEAVYEGGGPVAFLQQLAQLQMKKKK